MTKPAYPPWLDEKGLARRMIELEDDIIVEVYDPNEEPARPRTTTPKIPQSYLNHLKDKSRQE